MKNITLKIFNGYPAAGNEEVYKYFETLEQGTILELKAVEQSTGTVPMLRTWRGWMGEVAQHMAHKGCTMPLYIDGDGDPHGTRPFNADDSHELFTLKFLGTDEKGARLSWSMSKSGETELAPKSRRLYAMQKLEVWATENGIPIRIPKKCEYRDLCEETEQ